MSHEITIARNGSAEAAFSLVPAWHGLGTVTAEPVSIAALFDLAGLGWEVESVPALTDFNGNLLPVPGVKAIRRTDNGYVTGIVSKKYKEFQNVELLNIAKEVFGDANVGESAFSLFGGSKVVLLVRLGSDSLKVGKKEDAHETFLMLSCGHDGETPILALGTDVRVVCNNTFTLALSERSEDATVRIRHSARQNERVEDLIAALKTIREGHAGHMGMLKKLARAKLGKDLRSQYFGAVVNSILPAPEVKLDAVLAATEADGKVSLRERRRGELLDTILDMYAWETGVNGMPADSAYTAFQSVSDAVEHVVVNVRGTDQERAENRFISRTEGKGAAMKTAAMTLLDEVIAGSLVRPVTVA